MASHQRAPLRRFERMSRLRDYTIEKGLADPRGWKVVDAAGHLAGQVTDLVVDTDRMTASHLEVELDRKAFGLHDEPRILVPMARAERDGAARRVAIPDLTRSRINALFEARAQHEASFWERWWEDGWPAVHDDASGRDRSDHPPDRTSRETELGRAISEMRTGEEIRIPMGAEQLVVERRRIEPEAQITARDAEDDRLARQLEYEDRAGPPLDAPDEPPVLEEPRPRSRIDE